MRQIYLIAPCQKNKNFSSNVLTKSRCIQGYHVWINSARANKGPGINFTTVINLLTFFSTDSDGVKYKLTRGETRKNTVGSWCRFFPHRVFFLLFPVKNKTKPGVWFFFSFSNPFWWKLVNLSGIRRAVIWRNPMRSKV